MVGDVDGTDTVIFAMWITSIVGSDRPARKPLKAFDMVRHCDGTGRHSTKKNIIQVLTLITLVLNMRLRMKQCFIRTMSRLFKSLGIFTGRETSNSHILAG
jgi:hypothetical protein